MCTYREKFDKIFPELSLLPVPQDLKFEGKIARGTKALGYTKVGNDCLIMATSHIAHDCTIGDHVVIVNGCGIAGHVEIGDFAVIGGLSAVHQFSRIGKHVMVSGGTLFMKAGEEVTIVLKEADESPLSAEIPPTVTLEVIEADPGVKGNRQLTH
ncbi:hypothetical protein FQR65_LT19819 [Abscondita terminalis]|nr:hypothetical protein FQR65_LT19819 [Abscondita terminalis]